ncbi:MAG: response regulator [Chloroflexi bacterium]|nr:response regulator [Chloroflexota bacterium]
MKHLMAKTILIIEDDVLLRGAIADILDLHGYETLEAATGLGGIRLCNQNAPDLILCDVNLPGLTGYDIFTMMQNRPETAKIPFIFVTGVEAELSRMYQAYPNILGVLRKPFPMLELVNRIDNFFAKGLAEHNEQPRKYRPGRRSNGEEQNDTVQP